MFYSDLHRLLVGSFLLCLISVHLIHTRADNEQLICTASTPLNKRRLLAHHDELETETSHNIHHDHYNVHDYNLGRRRKLIAYEGGAAQTFTYETNKKERVKMMFSCEPNGFKASIYFNKRPCSSDNMNVYRAGSHFCRAPLLPLVGTTFTSLVTCCMCALFLHAAAGY